MNKIKRKLYKRGSSYETTVPMPMLFGLDPSKKYHVVFTYEELSLSSLEKRSQKKEKLRKENFGGKTGKWVVDFEEGK